MWDLGLVIFDRCKNAFSGKRWILVMFCLFLMKDYFWLKFQQTQAIFEGEREQKTPKSSDFMDAA